MFDHVVLVAKEKYVEDALALVRTLGAKNIELIKLSNNFKPNRKYFITKPILDKIRSMINDGVKIDKLIIYDDLKPRHVVALIRDLGVEVLDKINLILEIFALHAGSKEAKLQIEMARITHELPLIREWVNRAKLGELPGFLGPGAYAIDTYYRHLRKRLCRIRRELQELRRRRSLERSKRSRLGFPQVAIAGYTNAGKTTLFNALTGENKPTGNEMFTTLSPKAKGVLIGDFKVVFVDTVGFIRDIPAEVIEAFYATLEEIAESDLTIMVIDSSENLETIEYKVRASLETLFKVGYVGKPLIIALNKIDLVNYEHIVRVRELVSRILSSYYPWDYSLVDISAIRGTNLSKLKEVILHYLRKTKTENICVKTRS